MRPELKPISKNKYPEPGILEKVAIRNTLLDDNLNSKSEMVQSMVQQNHININENAPLMAMILSSRNGEKERTAIRDTWLSDEFSKSRGVFLVGKDFCPHQKALRSDPSSCELDNSKLTLTGELIDQHINTLQEQYVQLENNNTASLNNEHNLIMLPMTDTYKNLTLKVKLGVKWMVENTNAKWLLKVDDDTYDELAHIWARNVK